MLRDDLIAARALIDTPEKWGKGSDISPANGRYCAAVACNDFRSPAAMFDLLFEALPERFQQRGGLIRVGAVFDFNDHPTTTHADVLALFDRAIQAATPEPENRS
ncbi:MAG TPA: hypothetical protein VEC60_12395 [Reyranella sp.]|nr:hypothetical protein [Reyranella sp.]